MKNSYPLNTSIAIMKYTGVWLPDNTRYLIHYKIFAFVFQLLIFFSVVLAEIAYVFTVFGDTELTVDATVLLLSHLVQGIKVLNIWSRQNRIKKLITWIDGPDFTKTHPNEKAILEKSAKMYALLGQVMALAAFVTAIFWSIVPALKTQMTFPLKTVYPFQVNDSFTFGVMYAYLSVSVILVGVGDAAENYLVTCLVVIVCTQLEVLCADLKNIGRNGSENIYKETVACIKYHHNIIQYVKELADVFSLPIFCQFVTSSLIVCMTVFKITISREPIEITTMIFYLICVFMELLMYCMPGDLLINKSLLVSEAAYPNHWIDDTRHNKALLLMSLRAQRPLEMRAGGVFKVCLPTAAAIVQTSYSYYALLRQKTNG